MTYLIMILSLTVFFLTGFFIGLKATNKKPKSLIKRIKAKITSKAFEEEYKQFLEYDGSL